MIISIGYCCRGEQLASSILREASSLSYQTLCCCLQRSYVTVLWIPRDSLSCTSRSTDVYVSLSSIHDNVVTCRLHLCSAQLMKLFELMNMELELGFDEDHCSQQGS